jgi:CubicO group peptidase (beta-lactamase class C family)
MTIAKSLPRMGNFLLALLLFALPAAASDFDPAKLAEVRGKMQKYVDEGFVSGLVAVIGNSQGIALEEALGQTNLEKQQAMPKDALFRIASMTKPITAIGIMILQEEGKLNVEDPVEKYLPEFKGQMLLASKDKDSITLKKPSRPITLRDLLTHTSGLSAFPPGLADIYFKRNYTLAEATAVMSQRPLDFEPGSKWAYCNPGLDTLGRIIEVVSGQSYESFLNHRIFQPLGMRDTSPYPDEKQLTRLATLYGMKEGKLNDVGFQLIGPVAGAKHPIPAGGLYSTGADLAKLYQMMLNKGQLNGKRILSEESVAAMTKLQTNDLQTGFVSGMGFGFGWAVVRKPEGVTAMLSPGTYGHGGAFGTQAWVDPQQDLFVVLLIQRTGLANADGSDLRRDLQQAAVNALRK